jgi:hypothetical protein
MSETCRAASVEVVVWQLGWLTVEVDARKSSQEARAMRKSLDDETIIVGQPNVVLSGP